MSKLSVKSGYYLNNKNTYTSPEEAFNELIKYIKIHKDELDIVNIDPTNLHVQIKLSNTNNNISRYVPLPCLNLTDFNKAYLRATATYICKYENRKISFN